MAEQLLGGAGVGAALSGRSCAWQESNLRKVPAREGAAFLTADLKRPGGEGRLRSISPAPVDPGERGRNQMMRLLPSPDLEKPVLYGRRDEL
jgi:hypothetical protein